MTAIAAWWGLGYAALWVAVATYGWHAVHRYASLYRQRAWPKAKAILWTGQILSAICTILLGIGLSMRAARGHGWPLVSSADIAAAIALLLLLLHVIWSPFARERQAGLAATSISLVLLSYGLSQFPQSPVALPVTSKASLFSDALNLCAGSFLAMAASASLTDVVRTSYARQHAERGRPVEDNEQGSEVLVRVALVCLAASLAIDTWWLQKVGLGNDGDVQQAGIAIAWMVYFVALRLRTSAQWRGWPWASILVVGFVCTLPILLDVPWLGNRLPI